MEEQKGDLCVVFDKNFSECRLLLAVADCRLLLLGGIINNTSFVSLQAGEVKGMKASKHLNLLATVIM